MSGNHPDKDRKKIAIVGAGLAGSMAAALLAKLDFDITIFEKRPDHHSVPKPSNTSSSAATSATSSVHGNATNSLKRSINLALSYRGICALKELDQAILDQVLSDAVPMPGRVIHSKDGSQLFQRYGLPGQQLYSVSRFNLNEALLEHLRRYRNVRVHFSSQVQQIEHMAGRVSVRHYSNGDDAEGAGAFEQRDYCFDLIVGADGAYSKVRESLLSSQRVNFSRNYVRHGYKELNIPPRMDAGGNPQYALEPHEGLHIWPRGDFMLIALPNPDRSFTATLFAPFAGENGFDQHAQNKEGGQGER
ncbi:FAD-dependent monooxygenase, partial [archaeon]